MHQASLWFGFAGAWLLVAGPLWQAVIELSEEDVERERYQSTFDQVPPPRSSPWWWLLPPVHFVLQARRKQRWQRDFMTALPDEDYEALTSFFNKARGWMLVGTGGFLIAVKETWDVVEGNEWPVGVFPALVVLMALLSAASAALQAAERARVDGERAKRRAAKSQ